MRRASLLIAILSVTPSFADDVSPGMWEISMETRVPDQPGFAPPPFSTKQCFSAEDARDPSRVLAQVANPGASDCRYTNKNYSGNTFNFTMECAGSYGIKSTGRVTFTSTTLDGTIEGTAKVGENTVQTQNKLSGRRVGSC
jgi:uncharacterized protein DUF3617